MTQILLCRAGNVLELRVAIRVLRTLQRLRRALETVVERPQQLSDSLMADRHRLADRLAKLGELDLFEAAGIEALAAGARPSVATLGLMLSLAWAVEFLETDWRAAAMACTV